MELLAYILLGTAFISLVLICLFPDNSQSEIEKLEEDMRFIEEKFQIRKEAMNASRAIIREAIRAQHKERTLDEEFQDLIDSSR